MGKAKLRRRKPRRRTAPVTDQTTPASSLGINLKAFRISRQMLQTDLGEALGLQGRVISNIERGVRELTEQEISEFEKTFEVKLADVDTSVLREDLSLATGSQLYDEKTFFELQQEFLFRESEGEPYGQHRSYDLWFLNPESLPMLESEYVTKTWAENLRYGVSYRTLWLFDLTLPEDLQRFVGRVSDVIRSIPRSDSLRGVQGEVHVYPLRLGLRTNGDQQVLTEYYTALRKSPRSEAPNGVTLNLHPACQVSHKQGLWELLVRFYFDAASVVGYKPRNPLAKAMVVIALKDIARFGRTTSERGYCVLGHQSATKFMQLLRHAEQLLGSRRK